MSIEARLAGLDWARLTDQLDRRGWVTTGPLLSEEERKRLNPFDWRAAFPEVFKRPGGKAGFDCVIGNPPYVKLQHFRRVMPDVADYLLAARAKGLTRNSLLFKHSFKNAAVRPSKRRVRYGLVFDARTSPHPPSGKSTRAPSMSMVS